MAASQATLLAFETGQSDLASPCGPVIPNPDIRGFEVGGTFIPAGPLPQPVNASQPGFETGQIAFIPSDNGGSPPILGCMDPLASNYDPSATQDNGTCMYPEEILGCTDPAATNYNPNATRNDGTCIYSGDLNRYHKTISFYDVENITLVSPPPQPENYFYYRYEKYIDGAGKFYGALGINGYSYQPIGSKITLIFSVDGSEVTVEITVDGKDPNDDF